MDRRKGEWGDRLMSERQSDNSLPPSDKAAGQNVMEGVRRNSFSEAVIDGGEKESEGICGGLNN